MQRRTVALATVRVVIDHDESISAEAAVEAVNNEMDYNMTYSEGGIRIADTEIVEMEELG